jgi:hypothetical protein
MTSVRFREECKLTAEAVLRQRIMDQDSRMGGRNGWALPSAVWAASGSGR